MEESSSENDVSNYFGENDKALPDAPVSKGAKKEDFVPIYPRQRTLSLIVKDRIQMALTAGKDFVGKYKSIDFQVSLNLVHDIFHFICQGIVKVLFSL